MVCIAGKEEEGFNPILPLIFSHGQCKQLSLEGLRFVVFFASVVSYIPFLGNTHRRTDAAGPHSRRGLEMKNISLHSLAVDCWDSSHPMHFFSPACCCLETDSCISFVQWGKFLAAKLSLAIWPVGQQAPASFQAQDLSNVGIFHRGYSAASSNVDRDAS